MVCMSWLDALPRSNVGRGEEGSARRLDTALSVIFIAYSDGSINHAFSTKIEARDYEFLNGPRPPDKGPKDEQVSVGFER